MTKRRTRTPRDPRLQAMPDNFLDCRADRHGPFAAPTVKRTRYTRTGVDVMTTERACLSCGSVQIRQIVEYSTNINYAAGSLYKATTYEYAKGYLNPQPGTGQIPKPVVRLEAARRWLDAHPTPITTVD